MLGFPDEQYLEKLATTNEWFEHSFITTYCAMVAHKHHCLDIMFVHSMFNDREIVEQQVHVLPPTVKIVYSVLWWRSHFAVMECHVEKREICIYDGLVSHTSVGPYAARVESVLMRCALIPLNGNDHFAPTHGEKHYTLSVSNVTWSLHGPVSFVRQVDGHSCGPIACFKAMSVFGRVPAVVDTPSRSSPTEIRRMVVDDFRQLMIERMEGTRRQDMVDDGQKSQSNDGSHSSFTMVEIEQECIADQVLACKCTRGCTKRCRCLKSKSACGERCACKGLCKNCFNTS